MALLLQPMDSFSYSNLCIIAKNKIYIFLVSPCNIHFSATGLNLCASHKRPKIPNHLFIAMFFIFIEKAGYA